MIPSRQQVAGLENGISGILHLAHQGLADEASEQRGPTLGDLTIVLGLFQQQV